MRDHRLLVVLLTKYLALMHHYPLQGGWPAVRCAVCVRRDAGARVATAVLPRGVGEGNRAGRATAKRAVLPPHLHCVCRGGRGFDADLPLLLLAPVRNMRSA